MLKRDHILKWAIISLVILSFNNYVLAGKIIYVDDDAIGANNGSSWQNAYIYLQDALTEARSLEETVEIRVAQGIYKPDRGIGFTPEDRESTFELINGLTISGGFAGALSLNPNEQDYKKSQTILSGDLVDDDGPDFTNRTDNCYNVVTAYRVDRTSLLDGLIIQGGQASEDIYSTGMNGFGGGIALFISSLNIINCTFKNNYATCGGALGNDRLSNTKVYGCLFEDNYAESHGGAASNDTSELLFVNCKFIHNETGSENVYNSIGASGGALFTHDYGELNIKNCIFYGNTSDHGGAIHAVSRTFIENCLLENNSARIIGGGIRINSRVQMTSCTLINNSAETAGGAIWASDLIMSNSIVWANQAPFGSQISLANEYSNTYLTMTYCDIEGGFQGIDTSPKSTINWGQGMLNIDPVLKIEANDLDEIPDVELQVNSPCIDAGDPNNNIYLELDIDGKPRIVNERIDMGAYEYSENPGIFTNLEIIGESLINEEQSSKFNAIATFSNNQQIDISDLVFWNISPTEYAEFEPNGMLIAQGIDDYTKLQIYCRYITTSFEIAANKEVDYIPEWKKYYVHATKGSDSNDGLTLETAFASIQKAINVSENGDIVYVCPELYAENINLIGKAITLRGYNGAPVIDGGGYFSIIFENGEQGDSILQNFIIKNSFIGIFISGSSPTINNITLTENDYAIAAYGNCDPVIKNCVSWNNFKDDLVNCKASFSCIQRGSSGLLVITENPLFANSNNGDFHLMSQAGRWDSNIKSWVLDEVTSPCIDLGDTFDDYAQELWPHGKRINMGAYGGTCQASMSLLNYGHIADLDKNGIVDMNDSVLLIEQWNQQKNLIPEDLNRDGIVDYYDLVIFFNHYLEDEVPEGISLRDFWPFEVGNSWWNSRIVYDAGIEFEITDHFENNGFDIWDFEYEYGGPIGRGGPLPEDYYWVYLNGGLYKTYDLNDIDSLPNITGQMELQYPEIIRLNEPIYIPAASTSDVIAFQGTLEEVLELSQTNIYLSENEILTTDDFTAGNHANVLGIAVNSDKGTVLLELYGYNFGPMLISHRMYIMDGTVESEILTRITKPTENETFYRFDTIDIEAEVIHTTSPVIKMEFIIGQWSLVGTDNNGSDGWSVQCKLNSHGTYPLRVRATTESGMIVSSKPVYIDVQ